MKKDKKYEKISANFSDHDNGAGKVPELGSNIREQEPGIDHPGKSLERAAAAKALLLIDDLHVREILFQVVPYLA